LEIDGLIIRIVVRASFTPGLARLAYAVADQEAGVAAVIDPRRDVEDC
jgi:hypothetical protein